MSIFNHPSVMCDDDTTLTSFMVRGLPAAAPPEPWTLRMLGGAVIALLCIALNLLPEDDHPAVW